VASGREDVALCGGAEEAHATVAGIFDLLLAATTRYNDQPDASPRPFDDARDGLVIAEGAGTLVLESWEHAQARGAVALAEIVGYASNCDGAHLTSPSPVGMAAVMRAALRSADIGPDAIGYINAHATGTIIGDVAESQATREVLGDRVPISSTKGHMGHTLGGCGAIEAAVAILALRDDFLPPTRNLTQVDERCGGLDHVRGEGREARPQRVMSNNFAFGGINTSLVFART
jgi:3-oxoacyl-[acyl-carrier-protein] synthase II